MVAIHFGLKLKAQIKFKSKVDCPCHTFWNTFSAFYRSTSGPKIAVFVTSGDLHVSKINRVKQLIKF